MTKGRGAGQFLGPLFLENSMVEKKSYEELTEEIYEQHKDTLLPNFAIVRPESVTHKLPDGRKITITAEKGVISAKPAFSVGTDPDGKVRIEKLDDPNKLDSPPQ
jgi:hypothetical protein